MAGRVMSKRRRDLQRLPGVDRVTRTAGGHFRLTLINGSFVFTASTPSDNWRSMRNTISHVRRALRAAGKVNENFRARRIPND
jgi:hypothetical protein